MLEYLIVEVNIDYRNYNYEKGFPHVTLKVKDQSYELAIVCRLQIVLGIFFDIRVADNVVIHYFFGEFIDSSDFII